MTLYINWKEVPGFFGDDSNEVIARRVGCSAPTVSRARKRGGEPRQPRPKGSPPARPVIRDDGVRYESLNKAAKALWTSPTAVEQACQPGRTCKGHTFRFLTKDTQ